MAHHRLPSILLVLAVAAIPGAGGAKPASAPPSNAALPPSASRPAESKLEWLTFDAATALAAKQQKHMIVDIYTTWCGWCKVMDRKTYGDPDVADYLSRNFILARVNGESPSKLHWQGQELSERQFARVVGVTGYPATYFLKPDAEMLGGVAGFIQKPEFMIYAKYVSTRWYERGKIQDYMDSLRTAPQ